MPPGFGPRSWIALGIVAMCAGMAFVLGAPVEAAAVALVGGIAAVLVASLGGEREPEPAAPAPPVASDPTLDETIAAVDQPVLVVAEGRVTHANAAACELLGSHIVGEDVRLAIRHPGAAERLAAPIAGLPQGDIDLVGLGTLDQRWRMHVTRTHGGQRIVHLVDQTGSYAAERMRIDFVANASHELRTPLASILGYIETLQDEAGDDPGVRRRFLRIMFDEAQRMQRLVRDLISLSRIEAEKYRLPDDPVDLGDLADQVRDELHAAIDGRADAIVIDAPPTLAPVNGDAAQLSQLLHNLIGNALKYGRDGSQVTVRLHEDKPGMVSLAVTDQGDGIPPEHIPRLTERFYRVDPSRSRAGGGTGLGLAIVKHVVERHRGRLDITSQVGIGTTVSVLLPAHGPGVTKA